MCKDTENMLISTRFYLDNFFSLSTQNFFLHDLDKRLGLSLIW